VRQARTTVRTGEFGLAMLHARRLCIELIPTFSHGKEFRATAIEHALLP
jgi:hypothetical protein